MTIRTCTKVNIGLNVLRKRPDGYHDLETLFVPYWGLGDVLSVEPAERLSIEIQREGGVDWGPMEDLTVRAWRLLKADFPSLPPVAIRLEKHAPVGAGLGGGSADAAFMLRALNALANLGLSDSALAAYAAKLGSDCAFFVGLTPAKNDSSNPCHSVVAPSGPEGAPPATPPFVINADANVGLAGGVEIRPMFATGRGEVLEPFDIDLSGYELRVELPLDAATGRPVAVSTREAYSGIIPRLPASPSGHILPQFVSESGEIGVSGHNLPQFVSESGKIGVPGHNLPENVSESGKIGVPGHNLPQNVSESGRIGASGQIPPKTCCETVKGASPSVSSQGSALIPLREALRRPVAEWKGSVVNDFEATVCPRHPEIAALIEEFYRRGAVYAAMSGSGSAVFGLFPRR